MSTRLVPESEDFLYCSPETIAGYPQRSEEITADAQRPSAEVGQQVLWRTLSRHGLAALMLGFGAGMFASAALSLAVMLLSAG